MRQVLGVQSSLLGKLPTTVRPYVLKKPGQTVSGMTSQADLSPHRNPHVHYLGGLYLYEPFKTAL